MSERRRDSWGAEVTTTSDDALAAWERTVLSLCGHRADAANHNRETLAADPGFLPATCLRGFALLFKGRRALQVDVAEVVRSASAEVRRRDTSARERDLVAALEAWASDDVDTATARLVAIVARCPTDLLALKLQHGLLFMNGEREAMRRALEDALPAWEGRTLPGHGYVLGCHAFALEETFAFEEAERVGRRAVELEPRDAWGIHAVAHVMEMRDRPREGIDWLASRAEAYAPCAVFRGHVYWHRALFHCELGELDEALAIYDAEVKRSWVGDYRDMSNATSLLWRLEHEGLDVGDRWRPLAEIALRHCEDHGSAFADAHYLLALTRGSDGGCARLMESLERYESTGGSQAAVVLEVGRPLCAAMHALEQRSPGSSAIGHGLDAFARLRDAVPRIGGSNAQRDLFELFYVDAAIRAGASERARGVLEERLRRRPDNRWANARVAAL